MKTIAIIAQKGGPGKSTLAINLAVAAHLDGKGAMIADTDKQQTSASWFNDRKKLNLTMPYARQCFPNQLKAMLEKAEENGADLVFIDTAPHSDADSLEIAELADLILIPCRPGLKDLRALKMTENIIRLSQKPAIAVLNSCKPRSPEPDKAARYLERIGFQVCPVQIGDRVAFEYAYIAGQGVQEFEPDGKAAEEIRDLYTYVCQHINVANDKEVKTYVQAKA